MYYTTKERICQELFDYQFSSSLIYPLKQVHLCFDFIQVNSDLTDAQTSLNTKINNLFKNPISFTTLENQGEQIEVPSNCTYVLLMLRDTSYVVLDMIYIPVYALEYVSQFVLDMGSGSYAIQAIIFYNKNTHKFELGTTQATGFTFKDVYISFM